MNKAVLIESLMSTFVEEVADHVRSFNHDLLALESGQGDPASLLQSLFRTAHNLKGASRAVDVGLIENACHGLEDILARARDGERPLDAAAFEILFATADAIEDAGTSPQGKTVARLLAPGRADVPRLVPPAPTPSARRRCPPLLHRLRLSPRAPAPAPVMLDRREGDTLRVSANKLDTVLARSGELLLAVRQTERRRDEWATLEEAALGLASDFRRLQTLLSPDVATETRAAVQQVGADIDKLKDGLERAVAEAGAGRPRAGADGGGTGLRRAQLADGPVRRSG